MKKRCISFIRNFSIAVFCTFTAFSHCLFGYASNDDEFITFNTYETIQAYRYWSLYGLTADSSSSYTDTYVTNGSINLGNVNISLSSNGSMGGSGTAASSFEGMFHTFVGTGEDTYTLDISSANIADINPYSGQTNSLTLACTFTNYTNGAYENMSCTAPTFNEGVNYNVNLNAVNGAVTITGSRSDTYAIFRSTSNPSYDGENDSDLTMFTADSFNGSLSFNSSGGLSGSGTISTTTTTTNINNLKYVLPEMYGVINNPNTNNPNRLYRYYFYSNNPFVIAFLYTKDTNRNNFVFNIKRVGDSTNYLSTDLFNLYSGAYMLGGYNLILMETKSDLDRSFYSNYHFNIFDDSFFNNNKIIPLYIGLKNRMSDNIYRYLYGSDRLIEIMEQGNNNSQNKGQELDTKTNQMQTQMTQFQNIEDTAGDNMNTALQNINTNPALMSTNKFLVSVDWIRQQYNRLVTNNPFEAVITFCLVFGLGLLLLGKVR